jgi:hypothetical protein
MTDIEIVAQRRVEIVDAKYTETGVRRYKGNPFIEALPRIETTKRKFLTNLSQYPTPPTTSARKRGEIVRIMEMMVLNDLIYPFPEYQKAGIALATTLRDAYVARNPLASIDRQRRHALATNGRDGLPFPSDWKSSARGHLMIAVSGMGKTTFARAFLLRYPQVIRHTEYKGQELRCHQIVYLILRIPHDATLKSLCFQFFEEIDLLLGTDYARDARSRRQIGAMVQLMNQVATAVSLAFLVIDEVQNLSNAKGGTAEYVLNFFSELIEKVGISLLILATPAVQTVIEGSVRNARKIASYGETVIQPMGKNDPQWEDFCETYWEYTLVRQKGKLDKKVRDAWHDVSAGNTAFAALAFMLSQRNEIGGREIVDVTAFHRTAATDMAFLQPAIAALRSGDPRKLRAFDDLVFSPKYRALRKLLGAKESDSIASTPEEFDDLPSDDRSTAKRNSKTKRTPTRVDELLDLTLPIEDPLIL